jgi:hypothetical protein
LRGRNKLQQKAIPKTSQKREGMLQASSEEPLNKLWMIGAAQDHTKPPLKLPRSLRMRDYVNKQWALWFYECGIPFNVITSR